jgi:hypothetical protein
MFRWVGFDYEIIFDGSEIKQSFFLDDILVSGRIVV